MIANDTTQGAAQYPSGTRPATIVTWVLQLALAAMFLMAGGSKLGGAPAMIALFDAIGWGQWLRYVTGAIEMTAAIALMVPSAALYGALLAIPTMLGAVLTNLLLGEPPVVPVVLLLAASAVAWPRRAQLKALYVDR